MHIPTEMPEAIEYVGQQNRELLDIGRRDSLEISPVLNLAFEGWNCRCM
jgi:hypothetical protein